MQRRRLPTGGRIDRSRPIRFRFDGRKYEGDFKFGERTGQGTMTYPDGKKVSGEFKNGEFVGEN
jgi:hypothetical protein